MWVPHECHTILVWTLLEFSVHTRLGREGECVLFLLILWESLFKAWSSLLCDLSYLLKTLMEGGTSYQTSNSAMYIKPKALGGKAQLCCCRDCQLLQVWADRESGRLTANLQPGALFPNGGTQLCPLISHQDGLPESLGPSCGTFLSRSVTACSSIGIMTKNQKHRFSSWSGSGMMGKPLLSFLALLSFLIC